MIKCWPSDIFRYQLLNVAKTINQLIRIINRIQYIMNMAFNKPGVAFILTI